MIPVEVFLIALLVVYGLGRHHGAKALKKRYKDLFN